MSCGIEIGDSTLHFEQFQCHPMSQLPVINQHMEEMLRHGITVVLQCCDDQEA